MTIFYNIKMTKTCIIYGFGRSGSNILLDTFGLSSVTHCRNISNTQYDPSSPLKQLIIDNLDQNNLESSYNYAFQYWDQVVEHMASHWGNGDRIHPKAEQKIYFQNLAWLLRLPHSFINKAKLRNLSSFVFPELKNKEFQLPSWMLNHVWKNDKTNVLNVLNMHSIISVIIPWLLENKNDIQVVFLLRHPLGYAQSLYRRLYNYSSPDQLIFYQQKNILNIKNQLDYANLKNINVSVPEDIESLDLFESVIWNWILFHEVNYKLLSCQESFLTITYEDILANPITEIKSVFEHCSLPWNDYIETQVNYTFSQSAHLARSFETYWPEKTKKIVSELLSDSCLRELWNDDLWERLDTLVTTQKGEITYTPSRRM